MRQQVWIVLFIALMVPFVVHAQDEIPQWAVYAEATSEYTATDWNAMQATGRPDSKGCADAATAWASDAVTMSEALTVFYAEPVYASGVNIYQNYNPGAIVAVELIPADGSAPLPIPNSADTSTGCPRVFSLSFMPSRAAVFGVRIWLDQSTIGDWNEIDAVELVGKPATNVIPVDYSAVPQPNAQQADGPIGLGGPADGTTNTGGPSGRVVSCEGTSNFENGVAVTVVQMRSGYNYTATAIGLNGFDPVLAVMDESGDGLCADDDPDAATYSANLPTTGQVAPSVTNSQVPFANTSSNAFSDISLVVGGYDSQPGEFLLVLEGMTFSSADNAGDGFSVEVTPSMVNSNVDITAYVISVTSAYDPLVALIDPEYNVLYDDAGDPIVCDDAGNPQLCWGSSQGLSGSFISRTGNRQLPGGPLDAMLTVPLSQSDIGSYYNFIVNGAQNTYGDYVMVFHIGISE